MSTRTTNILRFWYFMSPSLVIVLIANPSLWGCALIGAASGIFHNIVKSIE